MRSLSLFLSRALARSRSSRFSDADLSNFRITSPPGKVTVEREALNRLRAARHAGFLPGAHACTRAQICNFYERAWAPTLTGPYTVYVEYLGPPLVPSPFARRISRPIRSRSSSRRECERASSSCAASLQLSRIRLVTNPPNYESVEVARGSEPGIKF